MTVEIFDHVEQGSDEWHALRCGVPTASVFSDIMAKQRDPAVDGMRRKLLDRLASEIITGEPTEGTYTNAAMQRGKELEGRARALYTMLSDKPVRQVGFVRNGRIGCSPDSLVGDDSGLEIKTQRSDLMMATLRRWQKDPSDAPPAHKWQIQGSMLVTKRDRWDNFYYAHDRMPTATFTYRRNPVECAELRSEIDRFVDELDRTVEEIRRMG